MPQPIKSFRIAIWSLLAVGLGIAVLLDLGLTPFSSQAALPELQNGRFYAEPGQIPEFSLISETGQPLTLENFYGHWTVIFAGYSHCSDICPLTLLQLKQAKLLLGKSAKQLEVWFLSLDPQRDNPEHLAKFVHSFAEDFRAATGSEPQLQNLAASLGLMAFPSPGGGDPDSYQLDHSAQLVLINPQGRLAGHLSPPFTPEQLATDFKLALAR